MPRRYGIWFVCDVCDCATDSVTGVPAKSCGLNPSYFENGLIWICEECLETMRKSIFWQEQ
jgi:hypothetical protein